MVEVASSGAFVRLPLLERTLIIVHVLVVALLIASGALFVVLDVQATTAIQATYGGIVAAALIYFLLLGRVRAYVDCQDLYVRNSFAHRKIALDSIGSVVTVRSLASGRVTCLVRKNRPWWSRIVLLTATTRLEDRSAGVREWLRTWEPPDDRAG